VFIKLADTLREKHLIALLSNDRFRAQLDLGGKEALWQQLDELTGKGGFKGKEEKCHTLCPLHAKKVFQAPANGKALCFCCHQSRIAGLNSHTTSAQVARMAWIEK